MTSSALTEPKRLAVKRLLIIASVCVLLAAVALYTAGAGASLRSSARRAWKEKAIAGIASRVADPAWATNELAVLKQRGTHDDSEYEGWLSDHMIVMRNGDWLACASICQKQNHRILDLFLARGSDGRWYYSTYHFCIDMIVLRGDEQPEDLAGFVKTYYLRLFDGHSDECLQKTWPQRTHD